MIFWTSGWRTTSRSLKWMNAISFSGARIFMAWRTPDFFGLGEVDLGDVGGHDEPRIEPLAGQDHLHLLPGRVLGLVQDDEGVVQGPAPHEGQGGDLDDALVHQPVGLVVLGEIEEGVIEGAEVRIDLLGDIPGEEAELFARFDRGPGQDDALDELVLEEGKGHGHGQVGLPGARRADPEDEVVRLDGLDVVLLVEALGADRLAGEAERLRRGVVLEGPAGAGRPFLEKVQGDVEILLLEVPALLVELPDLVEIGPGEFDLIGVAVDEKLVSPDGQAHPQAGLEPPQVPVEDPVEGRLADTGVGYLFHVRRVFWGRGERS